VGARGVSCSTSIHHASYTLHHAHTCVVRAGVGARGVSCSTIIHHTSYTIQGVGARGVSCTIHYTLYTILTTLTEESGGGGKRGELQAPYYHHTLYTILYYTHSYSLYYTVLYCIGELQAILITLYSSHHTHHTILITLCSPHYAHHTR
jgi:hypothetical protein